LIKIVLISNCSNYLKNEQLEQATNTSYRIVYLLVIVNWNLIRN